MQVNGLSWLGTYILFPIWSIWLGRALAAESPRETEIGHGQSAS
jgi:hypothetical protein